MVVVLLRGVVLAALCMHVQATQWTSETVKRGAPLLPLGVFRHLERIERTSAAFEASHEQQQHVFRSHDHKKADYEAHWFDQRVSHDPAVPPTENRTTFKQRYWLDTQYYKPGGPVFLLDAGETSGANRLPFLKQGILQILAKATNGVGIVFEHRYYGKSFPVDDLKTDSFRYLTTMQSLQDLAHFARTATLPGLEQYDLTADKAPWIVYGGSYAGAKAALARKLFPDVFWGGIASSAVTEAIESYWQYFDAIRQHAPARCMGPLQNHTALIDQLLSFQQPVITSTLKGLFGLPNVTSDVDFVNAISIPLGAWQARNWDAKVSTKLFDQYCDALTPDTDNTSSVVVVPAALEPVVRVALAGWPADPRKSFASFRKYADYVTENVAALCPEGKSQDECFGRGELKGHSLDEASWRSWSYQFCTEWGYFMGGSDVPEGTPTIVSRLIGPEHTQQVCVDAFPPGKLVQVPSTPNVTMINQYGGFDFEYSRLAFIDGSADPWRPATPHADVARKRKDTLDKPYKMIEEGVHHWDENGLSEHSSEPKRIRKIHAEEIEFVEHWLKEWRHRKQ